MKKNKGRDWDGKLFDLSKEEIKELSDDEYRDLKKTRKIMDSMTGSIAFDGSATELIEKVRKSKQFIIP